MRPGLVVLGVAFGVIGSGLIAAANLLPTSTTQTVPLGGYGPLAPHRSINYLLSGPGENSGHLSLAWSATGPVEVALWTTRCDATGANCSALAILVRWDATESGHMDGSVRYPMLFAFTNPGNGTIDFRFSGVEESTMTQAPNGVVLGLADAAGAVLIATGALAVFLGLFLRANPYGPPPALPSRTADDAALLAAEPGSDAEDDPFRPP